MKDYMKKFICIMLAAAIGLFLMGCGSKEAPAEEPVQEDSEITMDDIEEMEGAGEENYDNGISFEEEADGAEITTQKADVKDFMGSWEATSGQAKYQYGNVDFTIKEDGTWTGNITDEDFEGNWEESGDGISLKNDLFEFKLAFTDKGVLIMQYDPEDETGELVTNVLTKKQ